LRNENSVPFIFVTAMLLPLPIRQAILRVGVSYQHYDAPSVSSLRHRRFAQCTPSTRKRVSIGVGHSPYTLTSLS
jgi:hypothetical protein